MLRPLYHNADPLFDFSGSAHSFGQGCEGENFRAIFELD